jgi:hypothetical protein
LPLPCAAAAVRSARAASAAVYRPRCCAPCALPLPHHLGTGAPLHTCARRTPRLWPAHPCPSYKPPPACFAPPLTPTPPHPTLVPPDLCKATCPAKQSSIPGTFSWTKLQPLITIGRVQQHIRAFGGVGEHAAWPGPLFRLQGHKARPPRAGRRDRGCGSILSSEGLPVKPQGG